MAAAYLFHIVMNHPFVDGNKRTGTVAALVFLEWNGMELKLKPNLEKFRISRWLDTIKNPHFWQISLVEFVFQSVSSLAGNKM